MANSEVEAMNLKLTALQKKEDELLEEILIEQEKIDKNEYGEKWLNFIPESWRSLFNNNEDVSCEDPTKSFQRQIFNGTSRFLGIYFDDCSKEWVNENCYLYKAVVKSRVLNFYLDLSVDLWDNGDFMIESIKCQFINTPAYCLNEVDPWVQTICTLKNFALLLSAVYEYNDKYAIRSKLLGQVKEQNYGSLEESEGVKGGIIVHIHSPENPGKLYFDIHWTLLFSERSLEIVHFFSINSTDEGQDFVKKHKSLLEDFCALEISTEDLLELWSALFAAIDIYENGTNSSITSEIKE